MAVRVAEVGREGLVLWRLHRPPNDVLCCLVGPSEFGLLLVVRSEGRRLLVEAPRDVVKIVDRTETLKTACIRAHRCASAGDILRECVLSSHAARRRRSGDPIVSLVPDTHPLWRATRASPL
jgi:hypothetical protein